MHSLSAWCATRRDSEPGIVQCAWTSLTSQQLALKIQGHTQHPVGGLSHARSQALAQGSELQKVDWPAIFYSTALPFVGYQSSTCSRFTAVPPRWLQAAVFVDRCTHTHSVARANQALVGALSCRLVRDEAKDDASSVSGVLEIARATVLRAAAAWVMKGSSPSTRTSVGMPS